MSLPSSIIDDLDDVYYIINSDDKYVHITGAQDANGALKIRFDEAGSHHPGYYYLDNGYCSSRGREPCIWASDLGLYVHLHCLVADGAFEEHNAEVRFLPAPPPPSERMTAVLARVHRTTAAENDDLAPIPACQSVFSRSTGRRDGLNLYDIAAYAPWLTTWRACARPESLSPFHAEHRIQ